MTFVTMLVVSALVGWLAQSWKGRTGAAWGFITLLVLLATWFGFYFGTYSTLIHRDPNFYERDAAWYAVAIIASALGGLLMVLIVATLPSRKARGTAAETRSWEPANSSKSSFDGSTVAQSTTSTVVCVICGCNNQPGAKSCDACGVSFARYFRLQGEARAVPDHSPSETKQCPYCAEEINAAAIICRFCKLDLRTGQPIVPSNPLSIDQLRVEPRDLASSYPPQIQAPSRWRRNLILLTILAAMAALVFIGLRRWPTRSAEPPAASHDSGPRAGSTGPIGKVKRIRVSSTVHRNDLPVFLTKEALIKYLLAFNRGDTDTIVATLAADTFPVDDYTRVRVIDYDPVGNGFYKIEVLDGPKQSRVAWVMGMDLRD